MSNKPPPGPSGPRLDRLLADGMRSAWGAGLALPFRPASAGSRPMPVPGTLTARMRLDGVWGGEIVLLSSVTLARRAAGLLFGVAPAAASVTNVMAAMTTLAAHVGECLRRGLPGGCSLSTPSIGVWTDLAAQPESGDVWAEALLESDGDSLHIRVVGSPRTRVASRPFVKLRNHPVALRQGVRATTNRAPRAAGS